MGFLTIFKEVALPAVLIPNAMYLVAPVAKPGYVEIYVTDNTGTASRRTVTTQDIQTMIDTSLANLELGNRLLVVDDIAARDALEPTSNVTVLVINATGDNTVTAGAATYIHNADTHTWHKISESESMDVVFSWSKLLDKPVSTVAQIDAAVNASHNHANISQLAKIGQDTNGNLTYNGGYPKTPLETEAW